ncbi:MAG: hypothetical protein AAGD35_02475 [Actinomycetota bacterium]
MEPLPDPIKGDPTQHALWGRLAGFTIGDVDVAFGFSRRLARDNGWSPAFAERAIEEYKRFLFLGQVAGHPVTPSDEVDQAWHLHLTYTRSYWDDLCGQVLGRPFHHGPTVGGRAEAAKFDDWYDRTLRSYREWFGVEPPADLWPPAAMRFGDAPHYVRLNTRHALVVRRPQLGAGVARRLAGRTGLAVGASAVLVGCSGVGAIGLLAQDANVSRSEILIALGVLIALFILIGWLADRWGGKGPGGGGFGGPSGNDGTGAAGGCGGCAGSGCGGGGCGGCGG